MAGEQFPDPTKEINEALRAITPDDVEAALAASAGVPKPSIEALVAAVAEEGASMLYPGKIIQRAVEITHSETA